VTTDWISLADPGRLVGRVIEFHPEIGSTNDRARDLLADPSGEGTVVIADLQTTGRGRRGRSWLSPAGTNLMISVPLRPRLAAERGGWLAMAAALAVRGACEPTAPLWLRWPNDLVADEGLKVAGLLVEATLEGEWVRDAVVGIGINANWPSRADLPVELAGRATSLAELSGTEVDRFRLLERLLAHLDAEIRALEAGLAPLDRYRAAAWLNGRQVTVTLPAGELEGRVVGVSDHGALLVDDGSSTVEVAYGEVVRVVSDRLPAEVST
jgi:BirA family transcriptional regulator, biotin operon repressor / biotin---[acetyl-CoA-carboxylase] ligase